MTSSPTPDLSSLSISGQGHQRLYEPYDYDPIVPASSRPLYHFATSPPVPAQSQYNPLLGALGQTPPKAKPQRAALPTVSLLLTLYARDFLTDALMYFLFFSVSCYFTAMAR
jgi:hypothetical protein